MFTDATGRVFKDDPRKLFGVEKVRAVREADAVAKAKAEADKT